MGILGGFIGCIMAYMIMVSILDEADRKPLCVSAGGVWMASLPRGECLRKDAVIELKGEGK